MSAIIAEKFNKWSDKVHSGSSDITMLTRVDNIWYLIRNRKAEKLLFLKIVICEENGTAHNEFTLDSPPEEDCVLLIKDDQRMIMRRGEDHFDAFGMKNYGSIAKTVCCYALTSCTHYLIAAHHDSPSVNVIYSLTNQEPDAFFLCMKAGEILPVLPPRKEGASCAKMTCG